MNINKTGYTPGSLTSTNPYNIIPSNQISMREVDYPVYGIPMNQDGTVQPMVLMQPGENYDFPDAVSVMEIPAPNMKKGGKAEWISDKIQKIMREGETKDVKQAAAIAYSMYDKKDKKQYGGMVGSLQYGQPQNYGFPYGDFAYNEDSLAQPYISQPSPSPLDFSNINFRPINPVPPASAPNLGNYTPPVVDNNAYLAQQNLAAAQTIGRPQVSTANVQQYAAGLVPNVSEFMYSPEQSLQQNVQPTIEVAQNTVYETPQQPMSRQQFSNVNIFNPYGGVDISSAGYLFGQSLGQGNTGMSILSGAKLGLGLGRNILSGLGNAKATDRAYEDYRRRLLDQSRRYTSFQEGGTVADVLTGNYITEGMGEGFVPAELEGGEYVKTPQGQVQEVVGEKHSNGGVDLDLQPQTEVISDFTKVGATNAKYFRNEFDIKVKATDTFATVLDKYTKKIGLTDLIDEEKEVMVSIENQLQTEDPNKQTQDLNLQFLSGKIQEINTNKVPLEAMQKLAYDKIFEKQEKIPKKNTENKQEGGVITDEIVALATQYGIAPERAVELLKIESDNQMKNGGKVYMQGGGSPDYYTQSPFALTEYANQPFGAVNYLAGDVRDIATAEERLLQQAELLPNTLTRSGLIANGQPVLNNPEVIRSFQQNYNSMVNAFIANTQVNPNLSNEQKQSMIEKALNENFLTQEGTIRSIDATLGNYTSSRPAFGLPYLTPEDKAKYSSIKRIGDVIDDTGNIRPEYVDLNPQTKQAIQNTYRMSGADALDIGLLDIPAQADVAAVEEQIPTETAISQAGTLNTVALLPDQSPLPPSPLDPVLKANVRFERIDPVKISIEPNLIEADRQRQSVTNALGFLPDAQRASTIAQILGQTQTQTNQAISAAEAANTQAQFQADQFNIQQANREQLTRAETDLNYEARVLAGLNNTRDDIRGYYNKLQQNALGNFRYISDLNSLNAMYDNIAFTGSEYIPVGSPVNLQNTISYNNTANLTPTQKKELAKVDKERADKYAKILKNN